MFGAGAPASIEGHISNLIPELAVKDLSGLFVHPITASNTPPAVAPSSSGGGGGGGRSKPARGASKGSSMRGAAAIGRRGTGSSNSAAAGPVLHMQLPHLGDGGEVEVTLQVCVCL